ncbi:MAG: ATP-dependent 6-phosphofructokinase, partial [Candidatus Eisenbacteria sp.]|nr:ATP-dependent 6-phosphofructokinase [Candidatus Eisenbacteria bacterium]
MRIGILTGGGDCPGLNAAIRGVVRRSIDKYGSETMGIKKGWKGLVEGWVEPLGLYAVSGILPRGGTILGTSRTNPFKDPDSQLKIKDNMKKWDLDLIVAIGGEDTLSVAHRMHKSGIKAIGIPKTIDNDIAGTDFTFGFDTAVSIATDAIDRLHTTAESHHRIMVIEVMGRHTGWIAVYSGIAGGADAILIPEVACDIEELAKSLRSRHSRG